MRVPPPADPNRFVAAGVDAILQALPKRLPFAYPLGLYCFGDPAELYTSQLSPPT